MEKNFNIFLAIVAHIGLKKIKHENKTILWKYKKQNTDEMYIIFFTQRMLYFQPIQYIILNL